MTDSDRLTILDHNTDRADRLNREGIGYHLEDQRVRFPVTAVADPLLVHPVDVLLLCVKSYDVVNTLKFCRPLLSEQTLVIFMQNGISHLDAREHLGEAGAAFGTTTEGATLLDTGEVRHAGSGVTYLGFLHSPHAMAAKLLQSTHDILSAGGLQVRLVDNILTRLWAKLFINVGINALTAILGCKNGELLSLPGIDRRMEAAIDEAIRIAVRENVPIIDEPHQATRLVCRKTAQNISSMLQDVTKKRRTEIDAINGALVVLGKKLGIDTPENSLLVRQIKEMEAGYVR
jgi:2-dehydropantoate 2-reductase